MADPMIACDLHAHTVHSGHAFSTVDELAAAGGHAGLEVVGITDHGPSMEGAPHAGYFEMVGRLPREICGTKILMGAEVNILSIDGKLDLPNDLLSRLDLVLAGLHERTGFPDYSDARENTHAITCAMNNKFVSIISHPYRPRFATDVRELARASAATGVALEVNVSLLKWALSTTQDEDAVQVIGNTRCMIEELARQGGFCVVCSDAHHSSEIREFPTTSAQVINALEIPIEIIRNCRLDDLCTLNVSPYERR